MQDIRFEDVSVIGIKGWECNEFVQGSQQNVVPAACSQLEDEGLGEGGAKAD
jgi:hypothetical protein